MEKYTGESVFRVCFELLQLQSLEWADLVHSLLIIKIMILGSVMTQVPLLMCGIH